MDRDGLKPVPSRNAALLTRAAFHPAIQPAPEHVPPRTTPATEGGEGARTRRNHWAVPGESIHGSSLWDSIEPGNGRPEAWALGDAKELLQAHLTGAGDDESIENGQHAPAVF